MKKLIVLSIIFLAAAIVYLSLGEIENILQTLQKGNLWFILLAALIQGGWFVGLGLNYHALYRIFGVQKGTIPQMTLMAAAANFVNIIAPSASMSGMAVFISNARRNGQSPGKATVISMLFIFIDYIAFLCVLTAGLIILVRRNDLHTSEITASILILLIAVGLGFLLYLGSKSAEALGNVLARIARLINNFVRPFLHREYLHESRAHEFSREMADDLASLPGKYRSLFKPLGFALVNKGCMMGILAVIFLAFDIPFTAGTIIGGYSISYLFLIVSPTPSGIGIVEGIMPLALASLRVPWSQAVVITLAYRGITFWLSLGVGAISFRLLSRQT